MHDLSFSLTHTPFSLLVIVSPQYFDLGPLCRLIPKRQQLYFMYSEHSSSEISHTYIFKLCLRFWHQKIRHFSLSARALRKFNHHTQQELFIGHSHAAARVRFFLVEFTLGEYRKIYVGCFHALQESYSDWEQLISPSHLRINCATVKSAE